MLCVCVWNSVTKGTIMLMQGAGVHHRSLQPTKTLLCMQVNVPADQFLGAESAAGLVTNESQDLFLFPEMSFP